MNDLRNVGTDGERIAPSPVGDRRPGSSPAASLRETEVDTTPLRRRVAVSIRGGMLRFVRLDGGRSAPVAPYVETPGSRGEPQGS